MGAQTNGRDGAGAVLAAAGDEGGAADALSHRLIPAWSASGEGRTGRSLVADILAQVRPW